MENLIGNLVFGLLLFACVVVTIMKASKVCKKENDYTSTNDKLFEEGDEE